MFERLECAKAMLEDLKGDPAPKLERSFVRLNRIKNSERFKRLIELRDAGEDKETVRHLNLFNGHLIAAENTCPEARQLIRRLYGQVSGLMEMRRRIEHSVAIGG
jgi:hypothetical protein